MKLIHLADLHLGKRVYEFPMQEDQEYILNQILNIIDDEAKEKEKDPVAVVIAGDVYDKAVPSTEASTLLEQFLEALSNMEIPTFIISGNHDSADRMSFCSRLIKKSGIYFSRAYDGRVASYSLQDQYGMLNLYMLPFVKPVHVKRFFPEEEITTFSDAIRTAVQHMSIDPSIRNVLVTHQFVTGATRSDSEEISVGGADNVDATVFNDFDYVALGHIHGPQNVGSERLRYAGSPLKYSFSEVTHKKSVTIVELRLKGQLAIRTVELKPQHNMEEIEGTYDEVTLKHFYENEHPFYPNDYLHITLTDPYDIPNAVKKLRNIYPRLMKLDYKRLEINSNSVLSPDFSIETKSPNELFKQFYEWSNNSSMTEEQSDFIQQLINEIWEKEDTI